ncbi:MAG: hypothetical protein ACK5JS_02505 [Mangrovibacterium sp.]
MKRQVQKTGERKWYGDDHTMMQDELWAALEGFFEPYGSCILKGCEIGASGNKWTISSGIVGLWASDKSEYKICRLNQTELSTSKPVAYACLKSKEETEEYLTGGVKPVVKEYYAEISTSQPSYGEYLVIRQDGNNTAFRKAFQDATARMVSDEQVAYWNAKEPAISKKSGFNLSKSDSTASTSADVLATSKAVSNAKSEAVSTLQGGASSSVNTLKKLYDWAVEQLNGKAPKSHASTGTGYGIGTASNYGHVKLSDNVSSSEGANSGVAASSAAVRSLMNRVYRLERPMYLIEERVDVYFMPSDVGARWVCVTDKCILRFKPSDMREIPNGTELCEVSVISNNEFYLYADGYGELIFVGYREGSGWYADSDDNAVLRGSAKYTLIKVSDYEISVVLG